MASRETVLNQLLTVLATTGTFLTVGRRNLGSNKIGPAESPALFLLGDSEDHSGEINQPRRLVLTQKAVYLNDVGASQTVIPETAINNALDALDALLAPDNPMLGRCTLGGLVYSARIKGRTIKAPGDQTGKSLAIVPLEIILP